VLKTRLSLVTSGSEKYTSEALKGQASKNEAVIYSIRLRAIYIAHTSTIDLLLQKK
jgi:hypothetical protein